MMMTNEEYHKLKNRIELDCRKILGPANPEKIEDLAHEVMLYRLDNPNRTNQSIKQSIIDCLRKQSGRKGDISYDSRIEINNPSSQYDESEYPRSIGLIVGERENLRRFNGLLSRSEQRVFRLTAVDDLTPTEISKEMNVSPSRISQHLKNITRKVKRRFEMEENELSKAEQEVFKLVCKGLSNQEVADQLFVTDRTVKFHLTNIFRKKGVKSRTELVVKFQIGSIPERENEMNNLPISPPQDLQLYEDQIKVKRRNDMAKLSEVAELFKVNDSIKHLQDLSKEVTKENVTVETVMAACQCIGKINETINTTMKAVQVMKNA